MSILFKNSKAFLHNITPSYIKYNIVVLNILKVREMKPTNCMVIIVWQGGWAS
jgi:hypothetical protein